MKAKRCPDPLGDMDRCLVCRGCGEHCPVFVATHPDSQVALSATPAVVEQAKLWKFIDRLTVNRAGDGA